MQPLFTQKNTLTYEISTINISALDKAPSLACYYSMNYQKRLAKILQLINEVHKNKTIIDNQINGEISQKKEIVQTAYAAFIKTDAFMNSFDVHDNKISFRRGLDYVILEFTMIACGFNLYKYHNKKMRLPSSAA